jgi:tol-pal system protein YbgF
MRARLALVFCCVALTLPAASAWAGFFEDEEARKQITELRKEVDGLGKRVDSATQNQLDFANQAEALRANVARLMGQIEVLTNSLEMAHKRQQDFYVDLDTRLRKLEGTPVTMGTPAPDAALKPAAEAKPADPQAEMRDYEAALGHFRTSKFKEAQTAFEGFIAAYPKSSLLPNATYWLGSSQYQQKQYAKAAETFGRVAATWPTDTKAPDALLAQGNALVEAKDVKGAIKALETLVEKYPTSPAVETARTRLKTLAPKKK